MKKILTLLTIALSLVIISHSCKPDPEEELGSIYGIVTDKATGEPVKNANVQLRPSGETSLTGNDGRYEFLDLKNGNYSITVSKTGYTDLVDDYVIIVEGSKAMRRDVQIEKLPAELRVMDGEGNDITELDFGSMHDDNTRMFNIFNNGTTALEYEIIKTASWINSINPQQGSLQPGETKPVVIIIDRDKMSMGNNTTSISITTNNGGKLLTIKANKAGAISTFEAMDVTKTSALLCGSINENLTYTEKGFYYGDDHSVEKKQVVSGYSIGEFSHKLTDLEMKKTYYYKAYMIKVGGETVFGELMSFTTLGDNGGGGDDNGNDDNGNDDNEGEIENEKPTVSTSSVSNITETSATCGGNVTSDGGAAITARGVCWSTSQNPTINSNKTNEGSGTGSFTSNITGLNHNTTYYVRAYATNSEGTSYGEQKSFVTLEEVNKPTVSTSSVSNITQTSATCGGNVTSDGGAAITARGVCWSTSQNPTINSNKTNDGSGTGSFTSNITGLNHNTTYYVRAYATNSEGTSYGEQKSFVTLEEVNKPTVSTNSVSNITQTSATCGGNVTSDGGAAVTARGVCWSTSQNPTINSNKTNEGSGTGSFTSNITGLNHNTTYYVRAYATNSEGTSYGEVKSFTTEDKPSTGVINGHEYVDLGLPSGLKWATCNVGANSPEMPGGYYAWGELETKDDYSSNNSLTYGVEMDDISGDPAYDVAAAEWGSTWRMPKRSEINEMKSNCYYPEEIEINGRKCYKYTSAINGASIILPHTGEKSGYNIYYYNAFGCYWSSTPYQSNLNNRSYAKYNFGNGVEAPERFMGLSIRPVSE